MPLRFTIREPLWLTLMVALIVVRCLDGQELNRRIIIPDPPTNPAAYDPSAEILPQKNDLPSAQGRNKVIRD